MKRIILILTVVLLLPISLFSAQLTLDDAIKGAKANNKDYALKVKQYRDSIALNNRTNSFIPSLNLSGSIGTGANFFTQEDWDPTWSGLTYSVGVSSSLSLNGTSYFDKKTKEAKNQIAQNTLESAETALENSVISSYLGLLLDMENIKVAENTLESSRTTYQNAKDAYENGFGPELSVLQAENTVRLNELSLESLQNSMKLSVMSFNDLTGLNFSNYTEYEDLNYIKYLSVDSGNALYERYQTQIPALKTLRANINSTQISYESAKTATMVPVFSISGNYGISGSYTDKPSMATGFKNGTVRDNLSVNVSVSLPVSSYFSSSQSKIQLDTLSNTLSDLNTTYANTANTIRLSLEQLVTGLNTLESQIKNTEKSIGLIEETYKLTLDSYNNGQQSYASVQQILDNLTSTKYQVLSLKKTYIQNAYTLASTLGVDISVLY